MDNADGSSTSYEWDYNSDGSLSEVSEIITNADGSSTSFKWYYNSDGSLATACETISNADGSSTYYEWGYNSDGSHCFGESIDNADGSSTSYLWGYDSDGSLGGVFETINNADGSSTSYVWGYNSDGSLSFVAETINNAEGSSTYYEWGYYPGGLYCFNDGIFNADGSSSCYCWDYYTDGSPKDVYIDIVNADGSLAARYSWGYYSDGSLSLVYEAIFHADGSSTSYSWGYNSDGSLGEVFEIIHNADGSSTSYCWVLPDSPTNSPGSPPAAPAAPAAPDISPPAAPAAPDISPPPVPLAPTDYLVVTTPINVTVGTPFEVTAKAYTTLDNTVDTTYTGNLTIAIENDPNGNSILGGPTTITIDDGSGEADFDDLTLNKPGTGYTLQISGDNVTAATTDPFNVTQASTTTTVTSSTNPSVFGQSVTFTATVSVVSPGAGTPSGTVDFFDTTTGKDLGTVSLTGKTATVSTAGLSVGNHFITGTYNGDTNFTGSSGSWTQTVSQASTTTTVTSSTNPSVFGQSVTFTATVSVVSPGAGTPSGTVDFFDTTTGKDLGTVSLTGKTATVSTAGLSVGNHFITGTYNGDTNFTGSSGSWTQTVSQASTTTTVTSSTNPSVFGQSVTFTATVSVVSPGAGTPSGTVDFVDTTTGQDLGKVSLIGNTAIVSTAGLSVGNHFITGTYNGDTNFTGSSGSWTQTVSQASTTTTVTSSTNPSVFGQSVTLTATVSVVSPGAGTPSGTVDFVDTTTGKDLGTVSLTGKTATVSTAGLSVGNHFITGTYNGDTNFTGSSGSWTQTVSQASTTTTVTSSTNPSVFGQSVTFTATVSVVSPGAGTPSGTVHFFDTTTGKDLGTVSLIGTMATVSTAGLSVGNHFITGTYNGDTNFTGSSGSWTQTVSQASTTTTVTSSTNPSVFGQSVTFTATVSVVSPGAGTPSGTVDFVDTTTGQDLGKVSLIGKTATVSTAGLSVGNQVITATYSGDTNFTDSSGSWTQTVSQASTTTTVTSSTNPSVFGQSVTFTATVSVVSPGAGTPSGTVDFVDTTTSKDLGKVSLIGKTATVSTAGLSVGNHFITATYSGDTNFTGSSGSWTQTVSGGQTVAKAGTITVVTSSINPSMFGQSVLFTATVNVLSPGAGTPTGMVTFEDGSSSMGTGSLISGTATFATSSLTVGTHIITAVYSGDTNFSGSNSATFIETIEPVTPTGLQAVISGAEISNPSPAITLQAASSADAMSILSAVNGLSSPPAGQSVTIQLNSTANLSDVTVSPPAGVTLYITGSNGTTTWVGQSPALIVTSGTVIISNIIFKTNTAAPTIEVQGGTLELQNCVVQTSTSSIEPAILLTGGSLDLGTGTASDPGDNTLNINGLGEFVHNTTGKPVAAVDDTFKINGKKQCAPCLSFTALVSSASTSVFGQPVTFTFIAMANGSVSTPTGTVLFMDGNTILGTKPLHGGTASLTTSSLAVGKHAIIGIYGGSADVPWRHTGAGGGESRSSRHDDDSNFLGQPVGVRAERDVHGDGECGESRGRYAIRKGRFRRHDDRQRPGQGIVDRQ